MSNSTLEFRPSGTIEFEHVVIPSASPAAATAAAAVDDKIDADPLSINFGREKDSKPTAAERMLAGPTIDWLIAFAFEARPKALCERFPHVANRLARSWADKTASAHSLQALADDKRWGTAGFPALIQGELQRLLTVALAARPAA
jgi:hypothetical protein